MPFMNIKTNTKVSKENEEKIKTRLGQAISIIGKSEGWLMLQFEDECKMYFKGKSDMKMAMIDLSLYGKSTRKKYDELTQEITKIFNEELEIEPSNIYMSYNEIENWGWNGTNF